MYASSKCSGKIAHMLQLVCAFAACHCNTCMYQNLRCWLICSVTVDVLKLQTVIACTKALTNRADPDQTTSKKQFDQGLPVCFSS